MWFDVHKRMGFGRAGLYFWDEFPGRLLLLGKRFRAMDGPGRKKVSLCHLWRENTVDTAPYSQVHPTVQKIR